MIRDYSIDEMLLSFNENTGLSGFWYTRAAVREVIETVTEYGVVDFAITKEIYPAVAKNLKSTPMRVERSIRHYIKIGYEANPNRFAEFGFKKKPTNSTFITRIAVHIMDCKEIKNEATQ